MAAIIDVDALDLDGLDCLTAPLSSRAFYVPSSDPLKHDENAPRKSSRRRIVSYQTQEAESRAGERRKRTLSVSNAQNKSTNHSASKKVKLEDQMANTAASRSRRDACEAARKVWLHHNKHLFEPLLPPSSNFFANLANEVDRHASFTPLRELDEQPSLIQGGTMKDYQLLGLSFLVYMQTNGMNCILGDEMGLGKTLQTLSLFAYTREHSPGSQDPHLVICPLSVLSSWEAEAARWLPSFRTVRFHGAVSERARIKENLKGKESYDVVFTTYEAYVAEDSWFKSRRWTYCVLDEGHKIKNSETNVSHKLQGLGSMYRLLLTGTPLQNNMVELWALLHWLYPNVFTRASERIFSEAFDLTKGSYSLTFLTAAKKLLSVIMLRRTKATVELSVPPREELTVFIPMSEAQRFWTYRLLTRMAAPDLREVFGSSISEGTKVEKVESEAISISGAGRQEVIQQLLTQSASSAEISGNNRWMKLMNLLLQLRKVCDHPYLLPDAEPEPYYIGEHVVAASSKITVIDKLLGDILPRGERVLIFSQWTGMLDLLEDFMALRSIKYARLDGSTLRARRALDIKLFQQDVSPHQVYLISTKAGGLGINLTKATHVIMCDSDWNPQNDLQAIARAHRIGQTKTVKVYRLICQGSVEDQMLDRLRRKLFLSLKVMGSDSSSSSSGPNLGSSELLDILRKGSSVLASGGSGMSLSDFVAADITTILASSRSSERTRDAKMKNDLVKEESKENEVKGLEEVDEAKLLEDAEEEERRLLSGVAQVSSRLFDGQVVHRMDNKGIAKEWQSLQSRGRTNRIVWVNGMPFTVEPESHTAAPPPPKKRKKEPFESEDNCIHCHDGGEVVLCARCPRVFHAECAGLRKNQLKGQVSCAQHECTTCHRKTHQAGGMLFRCRTCPSAFCEDCLPKDDIEAIGETLPEFEVLNYGIMSSAYFIRCKDCQVFFKDNPQEWVWWSEHFAEAERVLAQ